MASVKDHIFLFLLVAAGLATVFGADEAPSFIGWEDFVLAEGEKPWMVVTKDRSGDVETITEAFEAVPANNEQRRKISDAGRLQAGPGEIPNVRPTSNVFCGEFNCTGPGSNLSQRVPWMRRLSEDEMKPFLGYNFIHGEDWLKLD